MVVKGQNPFGWVLNLTSSKLSQICRLGTLYDSLFFNELQCSCNYVGCSLWNVSLPISRAACDREKTATVYKSEKRKEMEEEGYRILGNSGDQWSDLLGSPMSVRSFKLPNPMYYIPWQILKKKGGWKMPCVYWMHFAPGPIEHNAEWWKLRIIWQWNLNCTKASLAPCGILIQNL